MDEFDRIIEGQQQLHGDDLLTAAAEGVVVAEWWFVRNAVERHGWPAVQAAIRSLDAPPPF